MIQIQVPDFSKQLSGGGIPSDWNPGETAIRGIKRRRLGVSDRFLPTRYDPTKYIVETLGWRPWTGQNGNPGQQEVIDAYVLALRQQHEKAAFEAGELDATGLHWWQPGQVIQSWIRIEAGHTVGKTKLASGMVNHFFDHFDPSIIYTFAPSWEQIKDLLWKEIASDRRGKGLPGRLLDTCEIKDTPNHFAKGRATNNAGGQGTERAQGQHERYQMFVLDEAEGIPDFVYDAVNSMTSGGISVVLLLANPRTRSSKFHKVASNSNVRNFRISCLHHPNVVAGREVVPGAVKRDYVIKMLEEHCRIVDAHDPDAFTFEVPWQPGRIYEPDPEFMFRVLGIAPANISDKNLVPVGRYEAAVKRKPIEQDPHKARLGLDCARFGADVGTLYVRWNGRVWRAARLARLDSIEYYQTVKRIALELKSRDVTSLHIRVDGGGGFGGGVIDNLKRDSELIKAFPDFKVFELHFGGAPRDKNAYFDCVTEWTADVAESLKGLSILSPPNELQDDLCDREYDWRNREGRAVKKLEEKALFRKRKKRSPDDGDGFVLAVVSDHIVTPSQSTPVAGGARPGLATYQPR